MPRETCRACGFPYIITDTSSIVLSAFLSLSRKELCIPCLSEIVDGWNESLDANTNECKRQVDENTNECKRQVDEKVAELEDLKSSLTFLRLTSVSEQRPDIQKSDVAIIVRGITDKPLHAHKFILSSRSSVFRTMFDVKMSEEETGIIQIDDCTLPAIRATIDFCYDAQIDFTDEVTPDEVLAVAHKYQIALLYEKCEKHLIKTLNNSNLAKRLRLAMKFDASGLQAAATTHFKSHFDDVIGDVLAELS